MKYLEYRRALKNGQVKPPERKKLAKIRPFSKKREKLNREYAKKSRAHWKGKPCRVRSQIRTGWAQGIHHPEGKDTPEKLMDPNNWIECCNPCNQFVEQRDAWARANGFKRSRLKK